MLRSFPFIEPCIPSQRNQPPDELSWLHEVKLDGWRGQFHRCDSVVRLYSKRGNALGFRFPDLVRSVTGLRVGDVILDGEITALRSSGPPQLRGASARRSRYLHTFWAFDLLRLGKCDLRRLALEERKARLADLLSAADSVHVHYSESFEDGHALLKAATRLGLEGVVSKKRGSDYHSGPCHEWAKIKSTAWRDANRDRWKLFERRG